MPFYSIKNKKLIPIKESLLDKIIEKDIQSLTEQNLEELFELEFLDTEVSISGFRIDTLAFDSETNSFVIIEYKRDRSFSVSDQGLSYLSLLLNHKADFVLKYNKIKKQNKSVEDFDWAQSRVMLIANSFTPHQLQALGFRDLPIELWEVKAYEDNLIYYDQLKIPVAEESIDVISRDKNYKKISKEIVRPSMEQILSKTIDKKTKQRINEIMEFCESLGDIQRYTIKRYIVYKTNKAFAKIYPQKNQFWVHVRRKGIKDKYKLIKHKHPIHGHIEVDNELDPYKVKDLIKQSYESTL
jgi:predicted transport protein